MALPFRQLQVLGLLVAAVASVSGCWIRSASAEEHEGRNNATAAALPELEREDNPFFLRQAWWHGTLAQGERTVIRHQLFNRNEYWFWVGCSDQESEVSVHIYDSGGSLVESAHWQKGNVSAARIKPGQSSSYFIVIELTKAVKSPDEWAVVYAYR